MIYPSHLQIETINGKCTARCIMCSIDSWTRKPRRMSIREFMSVLTKFLPYQGHLQYLSLQGWGESLLDYELPWKIKTAKELRFLGIGFASNCTELKELKSRALLSAGLDTLICSIDGVTKETHEAIRKCTDFNEIRGNVLHFISLRNDGGYLTKVIIRFIRQQLNAHEWQDFKNYWEQRLDKNLLDRVISFDIVDCDGKIRDYETKDVLPGVGIPMVCSQISERMIILSNGDVALCCGDDAGKFNLGNVFKEDPMEIWNGPTLTHYREMMTAGRIGELELCKGCTIPRSLDLKEGQALFPETGEEPRTVDGHVVYKKKEESCKS